MELQAIQHFTGEVWRTIYVSSYPGDVDEAYRDLAHAAPLSTLRRVSFGVDNYDFIAIYARDFSVLDLRQPVLETA